MDKLSHQEASRIEKWFNEVTLDIQKRQLEQYKILTPKAIPQDTPEIATQILSRFGLKTPKDVITFLNSKAGESYRDETLKLVNEREVAIANNRFLEREKLKQRQHAMLVLAVARQKAKAETEKKHRAQQSDIDTKLQKEASQSKTKSPALLEMEKSLFEAALVELQKEYEGKENYLSNIENDIGKLEAQIQAQNTRTALLEALDAMPELLLELSEDIFFTLHPDFNDEDKALVLELKQQKELIVEDERAYLVPKGRKLDSLSSTEREEAQAVANTLRPKLAPIRQNLVHAHQQEMQHAHNRLKELAAQRVKLRQEMSHIAKQYVSINKVLLKLTDSMRENQRQQANKQNKTPSKSNEAPTPNKKTPDSHPTVTRMYRLHNDNVRQTQATPSITMKMEPLQRSDMQRNITQAAQKGANIRHPQEVTIKPGMQPSQMQQDLRSLLKWAESLSAVTAESGSSREFHKDEAEHTEHNNKPPTPFSP